MRHSPPPGIDYLITIAAGVVWALTALTACPPSTSPREVVAVAVQAADAACTLLEGITPNRTVVQVCATAEEVGAVAEFISGFLRHGTPRTATLGGAQAAAEGRCTPLPGTPVCATREELGAGVQALLVRRRTVYLAGDGGVP